MARRRTSTFEDLIEVATQLPWWIGAVLAVLSYFGLHHVATLDNPPPAGLGNFGKFTGRQIYITFAMYAQFIIPTAFGIGSLASLVADLKRRRIHDGAAKRPKGKKTPPLSWREFELLISEAFRRRGYDVSETSAGPDDGVDLRLRKASALYLAQCKHWKTRRVGVNVVRELLGVISAEHADGGYLVTSGRFTKDAREFAASNGITLINGRDLDEMLEDARFEPLIDFPIGSTHTPALSAAACPECGTGMVRRTARKGPNTGNDFWGCPEFPKCRGTRSLA